MNEETAAWRQDIVHLSVVMGVVVWFNFEMIWDNRVPFFRDLGPYFYPMRYVLAQSFKAGAIPLWDQHTAMGFPFLAEFQSGVFYPPHLLYWVLPFFTAVRANFLFHYLVASTGGYVLARHWKYPPYLAAIAATMFALGGLVVSLTNLMNHFQAAVWLPLVVFLWERSLRFTSWTNVVGLALMLSAQFLAGSPEIYAMTLGLLLIDGLRARLSPRKRVPWKPFVLLLAANILVATLTMIQLLPTLELFFESRGQGGIIYSENVLWSLHPGSLINLFFPDKEVREDLGGGFLPFFVPETPFLVSHYIGVISLVGLSQWFLGAGKRERAIVLSLVGGSLILALGKYTPVYFYLFQNVPVVGLFRFPEKFFFITFALLLWAILKGVYGHLEGKQVSSRGPAVFTALTFVLVLGSYLFFHFETEPLIRFISWSTGAPPSDALTMTSGVLFFLERQAALGGALFLILFLHGRGKLRPVVSHMLLVSIVVFDLGSLHRSYRFLLRPEFVWKDPQFIPAAGSDRYRLFYYPGASDIHPSYYAVPTKRSFADFTSLLFQNGFPNTGVFHGVDYMQEISPLSRWPYKLFLGYGSKLSEENLYRLLGALNVKYITSLRPLSQSKGLKPEGSDEKQHFWLYGLERVVPRVYIVPEVIQENNADKIFALLSSSDFDPLKQAIVTKPLSVSSRTELRSNVRISHYTNHQVTVAAFLNRPSVLILTDSFYPGWRAYVDGEEREIFRANLFFRGVPLTEGKHVVEFRYEPRSFTAGAIVSGSTICALFIGSAFYVFRRRRKAISNSAS